MPSQLDGIVEGIAAQLRLVDELKSVVTYKPDQPGPLPMCFLDMETLRMPEDGWAPMGAMTMEWGIALYLVLAPIAAKASAAHTLARQIVPLVAEVLGHDLDAGGTLSGPPERDGIMRLDSISPPGFITIGRQNYYARRLLITAIEMFTYTYTE